MVSFIELARLRMRIVLETLNQVGIVGLVKLMRCKLRQYLLMDKALTDSQQYVLVAGVNDFTMLVDANDIGIGRELRNYRLHEPILTRLLPLFTRRGDTVLDIGANIGYYSLLFSKLVGPEGVVITVEPEPNNFTLLEVNLRLNRVNNVHLYQVAVSDHEGNATLFISNYSNWHSLRGRKVSTLREIEVPTVTIDAIANKIGVPINLIRMDIEGFEDKALHGGWETLRRDKPRLIMEVHPAEFESADEVRSMLAALSDLGYEVRFLILRGDDFPWVKRRRVWRCSMKHLLSNRILLGGPEAFVLMLEVVAK